MCASGAVLPPDWDAAATDLPLASHRVGDADVRLARLSSGIWNTGPAARDGRYTVLVDGEFAARDALWRRLGPSGTACPATDQALLLGLLAQGVSLEQCLREAEGGHFVMVHDRLRQRVLLANDRYGLRPHYYSSQPPRFVLAPTLRACLEAPWVSRALDPLSVAEYFCFQCVMEERTLLRDLQLFPAGSVAELDPATGAFTLRPYWSWRELAGATPPRSFDAAVEEVAARFRSACVASNRAEERRGVYLSGGLDSRLIVAALGGGASLSTLCYGPPDSPDIVYARRAARVAGTTHHEFLMRDARWLRELAPRHARLTEGGHGLSHAHNLWRVEEAARYMNVNLSGHFGDLLLGGSYVYAGTTDGLAASLWSVFIGKWGGGFRDVAQFADALALPAGDLTERMRSAFAASLAPYAELPPSVAHDLFALQFHGRKQIQYYLVHNRPWIESRTPFLDSALLRTLYSLPPEWRTDRRLQTAVLERYSPALAAVPWTGTRLPARNRGWSKAKARIQERLADLLYALTGTGYFGPRSASFNQSYGRWLGVELMDWVRTILTSPASMTRRLFRPPFLEQAMTNAHRNGGQAMLSVTTIGLLLTLELSAQELRLEL